MTAEGEDVLLVMVAFAAWAMRRDAAALRVAVVCKNCRRVGMRAGVKDGDRPFGTLELGLWNRQYF